MTRPVPGSDGGRKVRMVIPGDVPGKKNQLRIGKGRMFRDASVTAQIDALTWRIKERWGSEKTMQRARVTAYFYVLDGRGDIDNKYTTLQDCLVRAGAIKGDTIARIPGFSAQAEIIESGEESVIVELTEV